jgi:hypothetical protein
MKDEARRRRRDAKGDMEAPECRQAGRLALALPSYIGCNRLAGGRVGSPKPSGSVFLQSFRDAGSGRVGEFNGWWRPVGDGDVAGIATLCRSGRYGFRAHG